MTREARVRFQGKRPLDPRARSAVGELLARVLADHGAAGTASVVFVGDAEIRRLHKDFLGKDAPTDVLAFPLGPAPAEPFHDDLLGEVYVSVDAARREAQARGVPLEEELVLYAIHGVLHILGYDDSEPGPRRRMRRTEKKYLTQFTH